MTHSLLGFTHSSFAFGHESMVLKNDYKNAKVPPGALISTLQKGLLYAEAEAHLNEVCHFHMIIMLIIVGWV
jgi:hypothetical protein